MATFRDIFIDPELACEAEYSSIEELVRNVLTFENTPRKAYEVDDIDNEELSEASLEEIRGILYEFYSVSQGLLQTVERELDKPHYDLLEALRDAYQLIGEIKTCDWADLNQDGVIDHIEDAIAKAEGGE